MAGSQGPLLDAPSFRRNAVLMVLGSVASQGLLLLAMPVLSRLYSPEAIGLQALFVSISGTLGILASLRLDLAVVLPKEDEKAWLIWSLLIGQALLLSSLVTTLAIFASDALRRIFSPDIGSDTWLWLLGPMVFLTALAQGAQGIATRQGRFAVVVLSNLSLSGGFAIVACVAGLMGSPDSGPVWARFVGQALAAVLLAGALRLTWKRLTALRSMTQARSLWHEQRQFLMFNTPYSMISVVTRDLPLFVFSMGGSVAVAAAYALARMVTLAPTVLISSAISRVFYREAALHLGTPELERLARSLTRAGFLIGLPGFAFLLIWGDRLFEVVFGAPWTMAGEFSQLLAIPLWIALQTGWPERLFEVSRKQHISLAIQLSFDAVHVTVVITSFMITGEPLVAIGLYAISLTCYQVAYLVTVYRVARFQLVPLLRIMAVAVLVFGVFSFVLKMLRTEMGIDGFGGLATSAAFTTVLTIGLAVALLRWGFSADSAKVHSRRDESNGRTG